MHRTKHGKGFKILLSALLTAIILLSAAPKTTVSASAFTRKTKSRVIHVVYDDSGSMTAGDLTRWSQARYALEVFASMMGENDELTIYPMSSYSFLDGAAHQVKSETWGKTITIKGSDSASKRVETISKLNGSTSGGKDGRYINTPISSVEAAGQQLDEKNAEDKWLIILTDGIFDLGGGDGDHYDNAQAEIVLKDVSSVPGIRTAYVAIEPSQGMRMDHLSGDGFYSFNADKGKLLETVTEVATLVFNLQRIEVSGSGSKSVNPDIPISKMIVFAQGENVSVGDVNIDGKKIDAKPESVVTEVPENTPYKPNMSGYSNARVEPGLKGTVVTYTAKDDDHPFPAGRYEFSCNTDNVAVYFEPGVKIEAILEGPSGNVNITRGEGELDAGNKKVRLRMINPLTGEVIEPSASPLLKNAQMTLTVTDADGQTATCKDGDEVFIKEGELEIQTKAVFEGDIEKVSPAVKVKAGSPGLWVAFGNPKGYTVDITTLETSEPVTLRIFDAEGKPLTDEEYASMQCEITGPEGIAWKADLKEKGIYTLTPSYSTPEGMMAVNMEDAKLSVRVKTGVSGVSREGGAECALESGGEVTLNLQLSAVYPEEVYWEKGPDGKPQPTNEIPKNKKGEPEKDARKYMFHSSRLGKQEGVPYIVVRAEAEDLKRNKRPLTDAEWKAGLEGLKYKSKGIPEPGFMGFLYRVAGIVCAQSLDFDAELGAEPSTYNLYPRSLTPANVRPNTSTLEIELTIAMKNGITEKGTTQGQVSVKPQNILVYIGWLLLALALLILLLIFLFLEIFVKKRFDRDLYPNTIAYISNAGVPLAPGAPKVSKKRVQHKIWPPWAPEERDVKMEYAGYMDSPVNFHIKAGPDGTFQITNMKKFAMYSEKIRMNGLKYKDALASPPVFDRNSDIAVNVQRGTSSGKVIMTFVKQDTGADAGKKKR